jgi:HPt (histidine-containing phosphotransfer) domain-containing protein
VHRTAGTDVPVLDEFRLEALRAVGPDDGWGLLGVVARAFIDGAPEHRTRLADGVDDPAGLLAAAHALRGAASNLGALRLVATCQAVEDALAGPDARVDPRLLEEVGAELSVACHALQDLLCPPAGPPRPAGLGCGHE